MEINLLDKISIEELLSTFNESFSDYFVPLHLTPDQMKGKIKADKTNFAYSTGAFIDNRLVGFILHGFDVIDNKKVVYNGGTGVIPGQRKQGLTKKMYDFILPLLKSENIDTLLLEVISQNAHAIKIYETVGYKVTRKLICYKGEIKAISNPQVEIREMSDHDWKEMILFWDFTPSWQNSKRVCEEMKYTNRSYGAYINDKLIGYLIYDPLRNTVQQFAVDSKYRRNKVASTLFHHIINLHKRQLAIINVDEGSQATTDFLTSIGFEKFAEQLEMKMDLKTFESDNDHL
jgi:ribosomal protein S18 acetylase RimI-like enzyme